MLPASEGVLRVLRDVLVQEADDREIVAISREAAVAGEMLTIEMAGAPSAAPVRTHVIDSRPLIVDGAVRHRLRLRREA